MQGAQTSLMSFLPIIFLSLIWGLVGLWLTRKKGKTQWYHYVSCFILGWNYVYIFWLLTLTNIDTIEKLNATNEILKQLLDHTQIIDSTPAKWKCSCGQVNDLGVTNCPTCGLKRDFILKKVQIK